MKDFLFKRAGWRHIGSTRKMGDRYVGKLSETEFELREGKEGKITFVNQVDKQAKGAVYWQGPNYCLGSLYNYMAMVCVVLDAEKQDRFHQVFIKTKDIDYDTPGGDNTEIIEELFNVERRPKAPL